MPYDAFLGEIMFVAGGYAPKNWAECNGQLLNINTNQALFSLLGTTYGGNGVQTFGLPDLRGRTIMGYGTSSPMGTVQGEDFHSLTIGEMPQHNHTMAISNAAATSAVPIPAGTLGSSSGTTSDGDTFTANLYNSALTTPAAMGGPTISNNGSGQGHENRQPYNTLIACICTSGIFPSRN